MTSPSDEHVTSIDAATKMRPIVTAEVAPTGPADAAATRPIGEEPTLIDDRYDIEARLGVGGMGAVYRARDRLMQEANDPDPYIALKLILDSIQDPQASIALQREARRAQTLNHVNIVRVFYFGRDKDGRYYLTMELLRGKSLEQKLRDEPGPMSLAAALPLVEKVCSALSYAHAQGIVHSDIKPSNVFITDAGEPKLLDFGIASPMRSASGRETKFNPRSLGALSPNYASIEQFLGMDADPRDDVYSVACLTYELLSGQRPYGGEVAPRALEHSLVAKPIRALSRAQNEILASALCLHRKDRTATIEAFIGALKESGARTAKLRRTIWIAAPACVVLTAAAGTLIYDRALPAHAERIAPAATGSATPTAPTAPAAPGSAGTAGLTVAPVPLAAAPAGASAQAPTDPADAARLQAIADQAKSEEAARLKAVDELYQAEKSARLKAVEQEGRAEAAARLKAIDQINQSQINAQQQAAQSYPNAQDDAAAAQRQQRRQQQQACAFSKDRC
jgi:Protein kinase domain